MQLGEGLRVFEDPGFLDGEVASIDRQESLSGEELCGHVDDSRAQEGAVEYGDFVVLYDALPDGCGAGGGNDARLGEPDEGGPGDQRVGGERGGAAQADEVGDGAQGLRTDTPVGVDEVSEALELRLQGSDVVALIARTQVAPQGMAVASA